jgi:uncharacterized protein (TIGR02270 family)
MGSIEAQGASGPESTAHRLQRPAIPRVLQQHVDDAADLYAIRSRLCTAAHVTVEHLGRFDERLAAHLDALVIGGAQAARTAQAALANPSPGGVFVATVLALMARDRTGLDRLLAMVEAVPQALGGLTGAFGWLEPRQLRGVAAELLQSDVPFRRYVGLAACGMHRVDPGLSDSRLLNDVDARVRARAWRTAGELGRLDLLPAAIAAAIAEEESVCRARAAWAAVLLGDRERALEVLAAGARAAGPYGAQALELTLVVLSTTAGHEILKPLAADPAQLRRVIHGVGRIGDPRYVPWLINLMADEALARAAGEALSLITGADLAALGLERPPPPGQEPDAVGDPTEAMSEDEGLPWPEQAKVREWWHANADRFEPGVRYLTGMPVSPESCLTVLGSGGQRQRALAALHRATFMPGTVLFDCRAPVSRQRALLLTSAAQ